MNYLELVQDLFAETDMAGTAPTTLAGATGRTADLIRWVRDAWNEISGMKDEWLFKQTQFSFSTASLASDYDPAAAPLSLADFADWVPNTFRYYLTASGIRGEVPLAWMDYRAFRDYYLLGSRELDVGPPVAVTSAPNKHLLIGSPPDADYTIRGMYYASAPELTAETDVPGIPARLQKIIVYRALQAYGISEAAPEALAKGERGEARLILQLTRNQVATPQLAGPLA